MKRLYVIVIISILISGCASITSPNRKEDRSKIETCTLEKNRGLFFSSTKEDLAYTASPFIFDEFCVKIRGNCYIHQDLKIIAAIFTACDIPLALVRDLFELPTDYRYTKKMNACNVESAATKSPAELQTD